MRRQAYPVALWALLAFADAAAQEPALPKLGDVMGRLDDLYRADSSHARLKMSVKTEFYDRTLELESWSRGDEHALIVVRAPAREAGTATLKTPEGLWSYAPRADRLVRIPRAMLSESWMGSHFTNEDLVRETDYQRDYRTQLSWIQEGGRRLLRAEMIPGPDTPVVYSRILYFLEPDTWIPLRAEYYDRDEKVRTLEFSDVRDFGGRKVPAVLTVRPTRKPDELTRVEYVELHLGAQVDPSLFSPRGLRRAARP